MNTLTVAASHRHAEHHPLPMALDLLGNLLRYPGPEFGDLLAHARETIESLPLVAFSESIGSLTTDAREELYTATFDVTPRCVPYASIHLFGEENFKRGEFMAALHHQYETHGFDSNGELPDHIGNLLRYAATLEDPERRELVEFCILGPLGKISAALPEDNPYRHLLAAADQILRSAYPGIEPALSPIEQMRRHGAECPTVTATGCSCGPIEDGAPASAGVLEGNDFPYTPTEVGAPMQTASF
ncbi:MAG: molecular chaperone TorD family protein [Verrucomicrobia bacterium]|nr:molecular chaperone TorD family protein [Verrucomicrobiota bacterium]